jgi:hypothetical protein
VRKSLSRKDLMSVVEAVGNEPDARVPLENLEKRKQGFGTARVTPEC